MTLGPYNTMLATVSQKIILKDATTIMRYDKQNPFTSINPSSQNGQEILSRQDYNNT